MGKSVQGAGFRGKMGLGHVTLTCLKTEMLQHGDIICVGEHKGLEAEKGGRIGDDIKGLKNVDWTRAGLVIKLRRVSLKVVISDGTGRHREGLASLLLPPEKKGRDIGGTLACVCRKGGLDGVRSFPSVEPAV